MKARLKELSKIDKAKISNKMRSKKRNHTNRACCYNRYFNYIGYNKH